MSHACLIYPYIRHPVKCITYCALITGDEEVRETPPPRGCFPVCRENAILILLGFSVIFPIVNTLRMADSEGGVGGSILGKE